MTPLDPGRRRGRRWIVMITAALTLGSAAGLAATSGSASASATSAASTFTPVGPATGPAQPVTSFGTARTDDGSYPLDQIQVADGMYDVDVYSAAFHGPVRIRVVLPADWSSAPAQTWPTLFVLMGGTGATENFGGGGWTTHTQLAPFMAAKNVLTVIPDSDHAGLYVNWKNPSFSRHFSKPQFETFDTVELPQLLTRNFRSNGTNAVLGDSLGGFGAMYLSEMHPGLFTAAASMSGLLNLDNLAAWPMVAGAEARVGENPWGPFGDPWTDHAAWEAHNPINFTSRLKGMQIFVSAGNGQPNTAVDPDEQLDGLVIEVFANQVGQQFAAAAARSGATVTGDFYGAGAHDWPFWDREIPVAWPTLARGLGIPVSGFTPA